MRQTIDVSVSIALLLAVLVASCSSDDESSSSTGGSGGTAAVGGSGTGGSGTGGSGTGGSGTGGSGTGGTTVGAGGSGGTTTTGGAGGAAGAATGGSAGASTPTSDADCAAMTRGADCNRCCAELHTDGAQAYDTAYTLCVCTSGTCGYECSQSVCANPANPGPTPSCNTCLGEQTAEGAACDAATIQANCTDAGCAAYITCTNGCAG